MFIDIRSKLGVQLLFLFSGMLILSMCFLALLSIRMISDFGELSNARHEAHIRDRANGFMARIAHEQAMRYEGVFRRYARSSAVVARQSALLLETTSSGDGDIGPEADTLRPYPQNGIFSTGRDHNVMGLYWGAPVMEEGIWKKIHALAGIDTLLTVIKDQHPQAKAAYVVTKEGIARYYPNIYGVKDLPPSGEFDIRDAHWYVTAKPENNPEHATLWTSVYRDSVRQGLMITASTPVYGKDGAFLGASGIDLTLDTMVTDLLADTPACDLEGAVFSFLIDERGRLIAFPEEMLEMFELKIDRAQLVDASIVLKHSLLESANPEIGRVARAMLEHPYQVSSFKLNGQPHIIASHTMPSTGWRLAIAVPESSLLGSIETNQAFLNQTLKHVRERYVMVTALFLGLSLIACYIYLMRNLISPLNKLAAGIARVQRGDLTTRVKANVGNEIGLFGDAFNTMVASLSRVKEQEHDYARKLELRVEERTREITKTNEELAVALNILEQEVIEREHAEEELMRSEETLRNIIENSTNLFYSHTADHEITYISPQSYEFLQCSPEEAKIKWTEFATDHPCNRRALELTEKAIRTGERQPPYELELKGKAGKVVMVEVREVPVVKDGRTVSIVGSLTDITERKRAETILKNEKRFLDDLLEAVPVAICVKGADGVFISCNGAYAAAAGRLRENIIGKANEDVFPPELAQAFIDQDIETVATGSSLTFDMDGLSPSGDKKSYQFVKTPFFGLKDGAPGVISVGLDVTERKKAEQALKESESRYRTIFDFSPVSIWVQDLSRVKREVDILVASGVANLKAYLEENTERTADLVNGVRIVDINRASVELFEGKDRREILDNLFRIFSPRESVSLFIESITRLQETGEGPSSLFTIRTLKGERRIVRMNSVIVPGHEEDWSRALISWFDVTEILEAQRTAEKANKTKSIFLANMSHDLRTPINGVMGVLQVLESGMLGSREKQYIDMGIESCRRLVGLLSDILDITKIEAEMLTLAPRRFRPQEVFRELENMYSQQGGEDRRLQLTCSSEIPAYLFGDDHRLLQILMNLVNNGFKFSGGGTVEVDVSVTHKIGDRRTLLFTVTDSGMGIAEEKVPILFDVFTQADSTSARQGAGLGLAIVRNLTLLMGGGVCVESVESKGTTIYLHLPFEGGGTTEGPPLLPDPQEDVFEMDGFRVLVVEDDDISRVVVSSMLEAKGGKVDSAADGKSGLDMIRANDYDVVFMDVQLPDMDGLEVTRKVRGGDVEREKMELPIIAMTATAMAGDREKCLAAGMTDYLSKPVESDALLAALTKYVGRKKAQK